MVSETQRRAVKAWLEWNVGTDRESWETPTYLLGMSRGMVFRGPMIYEGDGNTPLGTYDRRSKHHPKGYVRLVLPNFLTIGRHRLIMKVASDMGVAVILVPRACLDQAELDRDSIEVIDTRPTKEPFRTSEQLLRGHVRTYIGMNGWRGPDRKKWNSWSERDAYFLSGFDTNERRLTYFFCELPPGVEPKTVAEAYEALKPPSVVAAEAAGKKVKRQGDMFMIRMPWSFRPKGDLLRRQYVHRTNHSADYRVVTDDGLTYISGPLRHRPSGRRPDHKTLHLGRRWWLCVKNTVPIAR